MNDKMVSFSQVMKDAKKTLGEAGIHDPSELEWLIAETLGKKRNDLKLILTISKKEEKQIRKHAKKRAMHQPLSSILGRTNFFGLDFCVSKHVLSPRPETEILAEETLKHIQKQIVPVKVLDLCTGSGCIAVTLAKNSNAEVWASDISRKALAVAKKNAEKHTANISLIHSDLFSKIDRNFDVIVSNPPYIARGEISGLDREVRGYDPLLSLDGGTDGLDFYRKIANESPLCLTKNGFLFLEIGQNQAQDVVNLLQKNFKNIRIVKDYSGNDRVIISERKAGTLC